VKMIAAVETRHCRVSLLPNEQAALYNDAPTSNAETQRRGEGLASGQFRGTHNMAAKELP
jgi:hypothetical protein